MDFLNHCAMHYYRLLLPFFEWLRQCITIVYRLYLKLSTKRRPGFTNFFLRCCLANQPSDVEPSRAGEVTDAKKHSKKIKNEYIAFQVPSSFKFENSDAMQV